MSTLIIKLEETNADRILDVLGDELERRSIGAYHLLIKDGMPLDPTDGSPHLAHERDEANLYVAAPELLEALRVMVGLATAFGAAQNGDEWQEVLQARAAIAKATGQNK